MTDRFHASEGEFFDYTVREIVENIETFRTVVRAQDEGKAFFYAELRKQATCGEDFKLGENMLVQRSPFLWIAGARELRIEVLRVP
jgi:hypothetical protein